MADIVIRGMEMPPEGEYHMTLYVCNDGYAYFDVDTFQVDEDRFEAVPLPKGHGRLIDANKVTDAKFLPEEASVSEYARGWNDALDAIKENAPSIIQPETKPAEAAAQNDERRAEDG